MYNLSSNTEGLGVTIKNLCLGVEAKTISLSPIISEGFYVTPVEGAFVWYYGDLTVMLYGDNTEIDYGH